MTDERGLAKRCETLEIRIAEQERTIEELSETVAAQWRAVETLERALRRLGERVDEVETGAGSVPVDRPPHY